MGLALWDLLDSLPQRLVDRAGHPVNILLGESLMVQGPTPLLEFSHSEGLATLLGGLLYSSICQDVLSLRLAVNLSS